ncbi:putative glucokinase regulator family protein [Umbelopsis sp. PMI_123]|nr:putative glucokinase regulator family protein [Umbelopsis sp. PMI_123]
MASKSLAQLLTVLSTEQANPKSANIDRISTRELLEIINDEDSYVPIAVRKELDSISKAIDQIYPRMLAGGRLIYVGCGTSGRLGVVDASECPPTYSADPDQVIGWMAGGDAAIRKAAEGVEDSFEKGNHDMEQFSITEDDTLVGIAASGRTPYVLGSIAHAKKRNALTVGLSFNKGIALEEAVDIMISPVCGPEVVTGSTRMKAGTATKLVLNMLSTGVMIKLGKTLGNLMVDVKASNEKLRARSRRIVKMAVGSEGYLPGSQHIVTIDDTKIDQLMQDCNGEVKLSILVCMTGLNVSDAIGLLERNNHVLRAALQEQQQLKGTSLNSVDSKMQSKSKARYLAIDCGGTKMAAVSLDESGNVVGQANIPSTNFATTPLPVFISNIQKVTHLACGTVSSLPKFNAIWIGSAGCDGPESQERFKPELIKLFKDTDSSNIKVTNDVDLLASGLDGKEGVVLIAGTGSIAIRYASSGKRIKRSGGLGYLVGDEGSGWDIGRAAIHHAGSVIDEQTSPSELSKRVLGELGCTDRVQFIEAVYSGDESSRKARIVKLAQIVLAAAEVNCCATSQEILTHAATNLSRIAQYVTKQGDIMVLGGGLLTGSSAYQDTVIRTLAKQGISLDKLVVVDNAALSAALSLL